jgi:hypothetical protein
VGGMTGFVEVLYMHGKCFGYVVQSITCSQGSTSRGHCSMRAISMHGRPCPIVFHPLPKYPACKGLFPWASEPQRASWLFTKAISHFELHSSAVSAMKPSTIVVDNSCKLDESATADVRKGAACGYL